ncbi:transmembrane protein 237B-like isoform X3 [Boleophthalmus pectinirostris]|uniref:transmembrane protein 237B-like isoform X3 n=1 Tax=Boleophthalmus pectinirostris TaxID=150288 RepID=UPI00242B1ECC|nr:transmembrane protein 237B-like isoform X3 [Boleophthalmus pectinirostris]
MRPRELPPLPQRGQRTLPTMPSEDSVGEAPKRKKKKLRKQFTVDTDANVTDGAVEMRGVSSSQLSDPGEHLPSDSHPDPAPQKSRRKKKKAATIDLEDYQADLVNTEAVEQSTEAVEVVKKTKKKKKPKHAEVPLPDELTVEEDDITTDGPPAHPHFMFTAPQTQSQPVAKVFVERNRRFQASERARGSRGSEQLDHMDLQPLVVWSTRDVSVRLHQGFRANLKVIYTTFLVLMELLLICQDAGAVLSGFSGRLCHVAHSGGICSSWTTPDRSVQPTAAVPWPGLPLPVSALPAAGPQHCGRLRPSESGQRLTDPETADDPRACGIGLLLVLLCFDPVSEPADD